MKYNKPRTVYRCAICGKQTQTLHEIIFGRGNRHICIKYNVQAPLCIDCHPQAHKSIGQLDFAKNLAKTMKFDYWTMHRAIMQKELRGYAVMMADDLGKNIKKFEVF